MDLAYANEQIYAPSDRASTPTPPKDTTTEDAPTPKPQNLPTSPRADLSTELTETFRAFSASPWGAKLGGLWGNVQKQSQSYYSEAVKEVEDLRTDAIKGFSSIQESLVNRTRGLSVGEEDAGKQAAAAQTTDQPAASNEAPKAAAESQQQAEEDTETFLHRFRTEAAARLAQVQRAEDAADEALLRFGTNIRNFLRDTISITGPDDDETPNPNDPSAKVLFESKDALTGRRVIHTSRLDAQLHVVHTSAKSFEADPDTDTESGEQWSKFKEEFDIDKKTEAIAADLEAYPELRQTMEGLVPEKVEYKDFWRRYYFLRHVLEVQEGRRRELLKASAKATSNEEEIGWDSDDDDEEEEQTQSKPPSLNISSPAANSSTTTLTQPLPSQSTPKPTATTTNLQPETQSRRSHDEKSVADSEASYDIVSGAPSRGGSSPKEKTREVGGGESDEEDWE